MDNPATKPLGQKNAPGTERRFGVPEASAVDGVVGRGGARSMPASRHPATSPRLWEGGRDALDRCRKTPLPPAMGPKRLQPRRELPHPAVGPGPNVLRARSTFLCSFRSYKHSDPAPRPPGSGAACTLRDAWATRPNQLYLFACPRNSVRSYTRYYAF